MMVDHGLGVATTKDLLDISAEYVDLAKIIVGTSALIEEIKLKQKIELYREYGIIAFPGGQFLEYAIWHDKTNDYFRDAQRIGYDLIEVSDNLLGLDLKVKHEIIRKAVNEFGLRVLGEVGSKSTTSSSQNLIADVQGCLEAGSWKVLVEAAEFFEGGSFNEHLADQILEEVETDDVIFELPGAWIPGIAESDVHSMQVWLLEHLGREVNVGNVATGSVLTFEALRRNLGVKMHFESKNRADAGG
jgi:phosphosulfolactate synthase